MAPSFRSRTRFVKSSGNGSGSGGGTYGRKYNPKTVTSGTLLSTEGTSAEEKAQRVRMGNQIDETMGFPRYDSGPKKVGWLINMHSTTVEFEGTGGKAGVDYYFLDGLGDSFKATLLYDPYFLIACKQGTEGEVEEWLRRKFEGLIKKTSRIPKEDLSMVCYCSISPCVFIWGRGGEALGGGNWLEGEGGLLTTKAIAKPSPRLPTHICTIGLCKCCRSIGRTERDHAISYQE